MASTTVNFANSYSPLQFNYDELDYEKFALPFRKQLKQYHSVLQEFTEEELQLLRWRLLWKSKAREKQLPPKEFDDLVKTIWMVRSGRGWGKTLVGANWIGIEAAMFPSQYHIVSPTQNDVRWVCFEGPSGLLSVIPPKLIRDRNKALPSITLWNGSILRGFAGDTPERLRGPQCAAAWCDEIASWMYPEDAWSNLLFGLRLGPNPRMLVTGTPKPSFFIRDLVNSPEVVDVVGSTYENRENLPKIFFQSVAKYEGTKIGRQELHGEVLDPEEAGFVKRSDWRMWPADRPLPTFKIVIMSLDTAFTERTFDKKKQTNDPTACTVWGVFEWKNPTTKKSETHIMLLDSWEDWLSYPQLIKRVKRERKFRYGASPLYPKIKSKAPIGERPGPRGKKIDIILIEDKGSGQSLRQSLAVENILSHGYNPGKLDKLSRLHVVSPLWTHHRIWAVESDRKPREFRKWAEPVITQICTYTGPGSTQRDDLMDSSTQALRLIYDEYMDPLTVEKDVDLERQREAHEEAKRATRPRNPYDV